MADPLTLLQEYTTGKRGLRELKHDGKLYYVFDDAAYQHDAKTSLSVYNKSDEYYSIESILHFWRMREMQHTAYVRDVSGKGIASITRVQRRDLIDFLKGGPLPKEANRLAPVPPPIQVSHLQDERNQNEPDKKKPRLEQENKGQRIDKILDQSIDKGEAPEVRGLSNELPAEKVAQLRTLVKKNLKNKPLDNESFVQISDMAMPDASSDTIGRFIAEKERMRKDRITCLESQSRDFSGILTVLKDIQVRENQAKMHSHQEASLNGVSQSLSTRNQKSPMPGGYSRYDQEIFQKETVADFEIETDLSFHGNAGLNQKLPGQSARSVITPSSSNGIQKTSSDHRRQVPNQITTSGGRPGQKRVSRTPIIIIPAGIGSLITMYNARDILQELRYVSAEEKRQQSKRENELLLQIAKNGATVPYRVIDNPTRLKDEEWDRVVAVFVQGPAWQFKNWKWNANPVEIFANIAAFHLKFDEQKMDQNVAKWSVNVLNLSRTKRHLDRSTLQRFWEILDRHISKSNKRDWLRY